MEIMGGTLGKIVVFLYYGLWICAPVNPILNTNIRMASFVVFMALLGIFATLCSLKSFPEELEILPGTKSVEATQDM